MDLVRTSSTAAESGRVITKFPSSTPLESRNNRISKKISSTVVFDDMDDCNECTALQGFDLSVDAVLSSGLCTTASVVKNRLVFNGSGLMREK